MRRISSRDRQIYARAVAGVTFREIGQELRLSTSRIGTIVNKVDWATRAERGLESQPTSVRWLAGAGRLSRRAENVLRYVYNIEDLRDATRLCPRDLRQCPNLGPQTVAEIVALMARLGLNLASDPPRRARRWRSAASLQLGTSA